MRTGKMKKIDISNEEPVNFIRKKIRSTDFDKPITKEVVAFNEDKFDIASILFNLQDTCNKYGITYDNVLVLIYLNELCVFRYTIYILDRRIDLKEYRSLGFIAEDFEVKRHNYYRITNRGKEIAEYFFSTLNNSSGVIGENRVLELDARAKMKSVLENHYRD